MYGGGDGGTGTVTYKYRSNLRVQYGAVNTLQMAVGLLHLWVTLLSLSHPVGGGGVGVAGGGPRPPHIPTAY